MTDENHELKPDIDTNPKPVPARKPRDGNKWLPFFFGLPLCTMAIIFWQMIYSQEQEYKLDKIRSQSIYRANQIEADLRNRFSTLQRIAIGWQFRSGMSRDEFIMNAQSYFTDVPGFQAIEWVDTSRHVRWVAPVKGNENVIDLDLSFEKNRYDAMEKARKTGMVSISAPINLVQGGNGFLVFFPIYAQDNFKGYVSAVLRTREWLNYVFNVKNVLEHDDQYRVSVYLDTMLVYQQDGWEQLSKQRLEMIAQTSIVDHRLFVHVRPTDTFISSNKTYVSSLIAIFGILLSLLVAAIVHLFQLARSKQWKAVTAQAALTKSEEQVRLLLNSTGEAIYGIDMKGNCTFANASCCKMLGYPSPGVLLGKNMHELIHHSFADGKPMPIETCKIYVAFRQGKEVHVDNEVLWKADGTCFPVEYWSYPQRLDGKIYGAVVTFIDITERKKTERELLVNEYRLKSALEGTGDGVWDWHVPSNMAYFSHRWKEMLGFSDDEITDNFHEWESRVHPDDLPVAKAKLDDHLKGGTPNFTAEFRMRHKNGSWRWILSRGVITERNDDGLPQRIIGTHVDISDRIAIDEELKLARTAADSANQAKSAFLASMSHEIRTPLNAVLGMSELLLDTRLSQAQHHYARTISIAGSSLLTIISDILDISKIEAGKLSLSPVKMDVWQLTEDIEHLFHKNAEDKKLELQITVDPDAPRFVIGDPGRIKQIFTNLIGNAMKFTASGGIIARLSAETEEVSTCIMRIEVRDTGIGIVEKDIPLLFTKFTQLESSRSRMQGGTGLGLVICRELAHLMGGEVTVESEIGKGTCFTVTIKVECIPDGETYTFGLGHRIVLAIRKEQCHYCPVGDLRCMHLKRYLIRWGFRVDNEDAVDSAEAILICALMLPQMREILNEKNKPVIILDADVETFDEISSLKGVVTVIEHPAKTTELLDAMQKLVAGTLGSSTAAEPQPPLTVPNILALVVDDNKFNRDVAIALLSSMGCKALTAINGEIAINMIAEYHFDIVFLDILMPVMDGYEAARRIRSLPTPQKEVPIIAMTAIALGGEQERCLAAGMDAYITKPVRKEMLRQCLETYVRRAPSDLKPSPGAASSLQKISNSDGIPVWNREQLDQITGDNKTIAAKLVASFMQSVRTSIAELEKSLNMNDLPAAQRFAHTVKGQAANIGGERLRNVALQLEHRLSAAGISECHDLLPSLKSELSAILATFTDNGFII